MALTHEQEHEIRAKWRSARSSVTRAMNLQRYARVVATVDATRSWFFDRGYPLPDDWRILENARESAQFEQSIGRWQPRSYRRGE